MRQELTNSHSYIPKGNIEALRKNYSIRGSVVGVEEHLLAEVEQVFPDILSFLDGNNRFNAYSRNMLTYLQDIKAGNNKTSFEDHPALRVHFENADVSEMDNILHVF